MKKKNVLLLVLVGLLFNSFVFAYSTKDTILINQWNEKSLELAFSDPKEGLKIIEKTIAFCQKTGFVKGEAMAYIRRGITYDVISKPDEAIAAYRRAIELAQTVDYPKGEGSALNNIGLILMAENRLPEARVYFQKAFDIIRRLNNDQLLGSIANNLGMIYHETDRDEKALYWFRKSVAFKLKANDLVEVANTFANISDLYQGQNNFDSAAFYSYRAIEIYQKNNNRFHLGKSFNNLALILVKTNQREAEKFYLQSLEIAREIENLPMQVSTSYNLSQLYRKQQKVKQEFKLLEEIYPLIQRDGTDELAYKVCFAFAVWHFNHGDKKRGDQLLEEYAAHHRSYFNAIQAKNLAEIERKYEMNQQIQANKILKKSNQLKSLTIKKNKQQTILLNLIWTAGLSIIALVGLGLVFWFRKRNTIRELESQKAVLEATLQERKRISFDLHDNVGSQLSYVVSNLEMLNEATQQADEAQKDRIQRTYKMSQEAIDSLRDTVWALHNSSITVDMLADKLQTHARKVIDQHQSIDVQFQFSSLTNPVISPEHTMHVFRIFQESFSNIWRHAGATAVLVRLEELPSREIVMQIVDNGKGIEYTDSPKGHFGLKNMFDRASQIGGILKVERISTGGTSITLTFGGLS